MTRQLVGDDAARAGTVVYHDVLAPGFGEALRDDGL
jgi:hypothetical protein